MTLKLKRPPPRSKRLGADPNAKRRAAELQALRAPAVQKALRGVANATRAKRGLAPLDDGPKNAKATRKASRGLPRAEKRELARRMGIEPERGVVNEAHRIVFGAVLDEPAKRTGKPVIERRTGSKWTDEKSAELAARMGAGPAIKAKSSPYKVVLGGAAKRKDGGSR